MPASATTPVAVLDQLDAADRRELEQRGGRRRFKPGSTLMHEGGPGAEVILLLSGRVKASVTNADGREVVLGFQGPGELVGELAVIDDRARSSTVEALEEVEALAVSAPDFRALLDRPGFSKLLLRSLAERFRDADRRRIEFASAQTLGRVAARLIELADRHGEPDRDAIVITLPISQEELAGWTGASREAVAKALATLRNLGAIRTDRRRITILDPQALKRQSA
jgi:CRP-like cAMP-binding protein